MKNEILEEYLKYTGGKEITSWWDQRLDSSIECISVRHKLIGKYAHAIPNLEAIQTIVRYSPIVEICAGRGYWAKLISDAGGDILAFDSHPPTKTDRNGYFKTAGVFTKVARGGATISSQYPDRTLFLCWPPPNDSTALRALQAYAGRYVIYIGEWCGCTGNEEFHEYLTDRFEKIQTVRIPQSPYIHDQMWVFERN